MADFKVVHRKGRRNKKVKAPQYSAGGLDHEDLSNDVDAEATKVKLREACTFIQRSEFYTDVKAKLSHRNSDISVERLISYGVGNFSDCVIARYQLALLMALREDLEVSWENCEIYDPKFWSVEKDILADAGFVLIDRNEEGKRLTEIPTLYHMLHCGKSLYNNLLWTNWKAENIQKMVVIGNSFRNMIDSTPRRLLEKSANYILQIEPYIEETLLPSSFVYPDVFNDTAIITFPTHLVQSAPVELWENCPEPQYDEEDLEFIPNK